MKIEIPDFQSDERGVSPVIGVILMVAITVILAAVIGAFVLDLGSQLGTTGPQTQLTVSDADESIDSTVNDAIVIEHKGGDDLKAADMKLLIQKGGTTVVEDSSLGDGQTISPTPGGLQWKTSAPPTTISVGSTLVLEETGTSSFSSGTYTVKVIHKPSGSVITSSTVEVA